MILSVKQLLLKEKTWNKYFTIFSARIVAMVTKNVSKNNIPCKDDFRMDKSRDYTVFKGLYSNHRFKGYLDLFLVKYILLSAK